MQLHAAFRLTWVQREKQMCKAEMIPDMYFGALRNIWFDERVLFNNNFPSLNHGNGINIYESVD